MERKKIALAKIIEPSSAARTEIDDDKLASLAESIKELGLINPITVKPGDDGCFEVVAGHRRLLAMRKLNVAYADCYIKPNTLSDDAVMIHENIEREELSPVDEGDKYLELYQKTGDMAKVAELVKKSLAYVERRVDLVYNKNREVVEACRKREISLGVAEEIHKMELERDQLYHLHYARRQGATVRQMRDYRIAANLRAEREREIPANTPPSSPGTTTTEPIPAPVPAYTHHAAPWQLSGELTPRRCIFCGQVHPEHTGFRIFTCGECADRHMLPKGMKPSDYEVS